jgi:hypothetical protein
MNIKLEGEKGWWEWRRMRHNEEVERLVEIKQKWIGGSGFRVCNPLGLFFLLQDLKEGLTTLICAMIKKIWWGGRRSK